MSATESHASTHPRTLSSQVRDATGESVFECYQCGKCSAGCPLAAEMDLPPSQVLRLLQLGLDGMEEEVLRSLSIWLCLTCETCVARCPKEVDLPRIMDYLRQKSLARGMVNPQAGDILAFHRSFLDSVRLAGRLYEVGLISAYKMRTFHMLQDLAVAPKLLMRGKLKLWPHTIAGKTEIARIFERAAGDEADKA